MKNNKLLHYGYLNLGLNFVQALFTLLLIFPIYIFSAFSVLIFLKFPFLNGFGFGPFLLPFTSISLAFILPPLFMIGFYGHSFKEKFYLMFQIQAFFYLIFVVLLTFFIFYVVNIDNLFETLSYSYYFSSINRILVCLFFYISINVCLAIQNLPLPIYFKNLDKDDADFNIDGVSYTFFGQNFMNLSNHEKKHSADNYIFMPQDNLYQKLKSDDNKQIDYDELLDDPNQISTIKSNGINQHNAKDYILFFEKNRNKNVIKNAWKRHYREIPLQIRISILFAQFVGLLFLILSVLPIFNLEHPQFVSGYSFLALFFLYFYILYSIQKRAYAFWRFAYLFVNLVFIMLNIFFESYSWQIIFLIFFFSQVYVVYNFYSKRKWFI